MPKLFGIDIAGIVNANISPGLLDAQLVRITKGTRTTGSLSAGSNPTEQTVNCKGFISEYDDRRIDGTIVKAGDREVTLIGRSLSSSDSVVPNINDKIKIEGQTFKIVNPVKRDPAAATYICQARL